jgi:hypothetical protein
MKRLNLSKVTVVAAVWATTLAGTARAEMLTTYIGIDGRETLVSGVYVGQPNPNFGRLTFLHAHWYESTFANNHYHGIGAYSYSGPAGSPTINNTSSGNRIPEVYTALPPLTLLTATPAHPLYAGRLMSLRSTEHYSDMRLRPTFDLKQYPTNSGQYYMFASSAGTRTNSLAGVAVALELVAKTDGLAIGNPTNVNLLVSPGDRMLLGEGDSWEALPLFSVAGDAAEGTYTATLKLVDLNAADYTTNQSGVFHLDFRVQPPPTLTIAETVKIEAPLVTDGYVLQWATDASGPWTSYTNLQYTVEVIGSGESAQQTFKRYWTIPKTGPQQFFRMYKP